MAGDWRDWFRNWSSPDSLAHPDSPAGGAGPGHSTILKEYDPSAHVPHPDSPAARSFSYQSALSQGQDPLALQFKRLFSKDEIARFRQNPFSYSDAPLLMKALLIYLQRDTTPPEERSRVRMRNLSLATGYALGLGQNTTKALSGDNISWAKVREEMPGNAMVAAGWSLKAFQEFRTVAMESKGFQEWLRTNDASRALAGEDELNVEAAFAENAPYRTGELKQINRVRMTAGGRQLISLEAISLTKAQREAAKAIHGQTMSGALLSAWRNAANPRELKEMEEVKRLWNLGTPQAQQEARELAVAAYERHRGRFWTAIRGDQGLGARFRDAGMKFSGSRTGAPFYDLPDGTKACMSLEHSFRKADNPTLAVAGENLQFVLVDENSYFLEKIRQNDPFQR
jgi:hypothetical protein